MPEKGFGADTWTLWGGKFPRGPKPGPYTHRGVGPGRPCTGPGGPTPQPFPGAGLPLTTPREAPSEEISPRGHLGPTGSTPKGSKTPANGATRHKTPDAPTIGATPSGAALRFPFFYSEQNSAGDSPPDRGTPPQRAASSLYTSDATSLVIHHAPPGDAVHA